MVTFFEKFGLIVDISAMIGTIQKIKIDVRILE